MGRWVGGWVGDESVSERASERAIQRVSKRVNAPVVSHWITNPQKYKPLKHPEAQQTFLRVFEKSEFPHLVSNKPGE